MGIKDEFHQKTILVCIDELCRPISDVSSETGLSEDLTDTGAATAGAESHRLIQQSFSKLERCDKCNKYLRGLIHQGFQCQGT